MREREIVAEFLSWISVQKDIHLVELTNCFRHTCNYHILEAEEIRDVLDEFQKTKMNERTDDF